MISGEAVEQRDLLALDDFSLWVLIDAVVNTKGVDDTLRDLGLRILARDLFKTVNCPSAKVRGFLQKPDGHAQIHKAIQPFCPGKPEYYLVVDTGSFSLFSQDKKHMAYFIDENRHAVPVRDHRAFRIYWQDSDDFVRLFTLREAVDSVQKLLMR